ncbi:MAG: CesT family type III secretion system chaperone [Planctomycetota bacterium]
MKLHDFIAAIRDELQLDSLEADDEGVYGIVFDDGLDVEIIALTSNDILLRSRLADLPTDEAEQDSLCDGLLKHNLAALRDQWASLSLDWDSGCFWLASRHRLDQVDLRGFFERLEGFVNSVAWWEKYLAFRQGSSAGDYSSRQGAMDSLFVNFIRP